MFVVSAMPLQTGWWFAALFSHQKMTCHQTAVSSQFTKKSGDIRVRPHTASGQLDDKFSQEEYNRLENHEEEISRFEKILGQLQTHFRIWTKPPMMQWWLRIILTCFCREQADDRQEREALNISIQDGFAGFSRKSFHSPHSFLQIPFLTVQKTGYLVVVVGQWLSSQLILEQWS